ncbi:ATPase dynein-related AAA domain [Trinorchestia longiramus]|nr:ATPase dynein-related AAA domain [Trinorchestia longiramus]
MYLGSSAAVSKLQVLQRILHYGSRFNGPAAVRVFLHSNSDGKRVSIGDVSRAIREPANPELVPHGYLSHNLSQWELRHLRWLMQKDNMGQDVFLIGGPGPLRRRIALAYLELTRQETEYVTLTRDTTEADLKQRREIRDATSYYHDQAGVVCVLQVCHQLLP